MRPLLLLALLLLLTAPPDCGKHKPPPPPTPTPTPTATATPTPAASPTPYSSPTPYPRPAFDSAGYLPIVGQRHVTITASANLTADLQAAQELPDIDFVQVVGDGPISNVVLKKSTFFNGTYDVQATQSSLGTLRLKDNVLVSGGTFLEPTFFDGSPAISVFQTYDGLYGEAHNVAITCVTVKGRQPKTDGGVRQTLSFGNCHHCAAVANNLEGIASIGIQFGGATGSTAQVHYADDFLVAQNKISGAGAAAIAVVNARRGIIIDNHVANPGRENGPGGVSAVDLESNNELDQLFDIQIFNNVADYRSSPLVSAGSAWLIQNAYRNQNPQQVGQVVVANNVALGGPLEANNWERHLTSGVYVNGPVPSLIVVNNYTTKSGQACMRFEEGTGYLVQDNSCVSCAGGGNSGVQFWNLSNSKFIRNLQYAAPATNWSYDTIFRGCDSPNNEFVDNVGTINLEPCPATRPRRKIPTGA